MYFGPGLISFSDSTGNPVGGCCVQQNQYWLALQPTVDRSVPTLSTEWDIHETPPLLVEDPTCRRWKGNRSSFGSRWRCVIWVFGDDHELENIESGVEGYLAMFVGFILISSVGWWCTVEAEQRVCFLSSLYLAPSVGCYLLMNDMTCVDGSLKYFPTSTDSWLHPINGSARLSLDVLNIKYIPTSYGVIWKFTIIKLVAQLHFMTFSCTTSHWR